MIYYRKTLFGRGPKLTAVHLDKKDFYLHDDHLTAQGHKKLGQWLAAQAIDFERR
jgi:hypothetical protein